MENFKTDVDILINLLRSNPHKEFSYPQLVILTGMSLDSLKKWIEILENRGDVQIIYRISEDVIRWIGLQLAEKRVGIDTRQQTKLNRQQLSDQLTDIMTSIREAKKRVQMLDKLKRNLQLQDKPQSPLLKTYSDMLEKEKLKLSALLKDANKLSFFIKKRNDKYII
jgi:hypothetical protein